MKKLIIALDGPSGAGKSTIGKLIAAKYSLKYFQSSILYRCLAFACIEHGIKPDDVSNVIKFANNYTFDEISADLSSEEIGNYTSKISAISVIRDKVNLELKNIISNTDQIIMEGRDIGSVIAPNAHLKLYLTADVRARAMRRYKQLRMEGKECILSEILRLMQERDLRDETRDNAPLMIPKDALVIDSSNISIDEIMHKIEIHIATLNAEGSL